MTMFKRLIAALLLVGGSMLAALPASSTPLPLNGPWVILDQFMAPGDFFKAPDGGTVWTVDCVAGRTCVLQITDLFVVTDQFEIYDFGVLIATTPAMPDWFGIGATDPLESPPWTNNPDTAFASGDFSALEIHLSGGAHSISIRDIHIPPIAIGGPPFPDGTVAFRLVPEPATLVLLGVALVGLGFVRRKKS